LSAAQHGWGRVCRSVGVESCPHLSIGSWRNNFQLFISAMIANVCCAQVTPLPIAAESMTGAGFWGKNNEKISKIRRPTKSYAFTSNPDVNGSQKLGDPIHAPCGRRTGPNFGIPKFVASLPPTWCTVTCFRVSLFCDLTATLIRPESIYRPRIRDAFLL